MYLLPKLDTPYWKRAGCYLVDPIIAHLRVRIEIDQGGSQVVISEMVSRGMPRMYGRHVEL